jgi:hypothetical protein
MHCSFMKSHPDILIPGHPGQIPYPHQNYGSTAGKVIPFYNPKYITYQNEKQAVFFVRRQAGISW